MLKTNVTYSIALLAQKLGQNAKISNRFLSTLANFLLLVLTTTKSALTHSDDYLWSRNCVENKKKLKHTRIQSSSPF